MDVRDYECDLQGIVNNAVYQHYLEHTRHEFLRSLGASFASITSTGVHLVVVRAELDYLFPLRSGDKFRVGLNLERVSPLRFGFIQHIHRIPDEKRILKARIICTALDRAGKPHMPQDIESLLSVHLQGKESP